MSPVQRPHWKKHQPGKPLWQRLVYALLYVFSLVAGGKIMPGASAKTPQFIRPLFQRIRTQEAKAAEASEMLQENPAAEPVAVRTHAVASEESLWEIAQMELGEGEKWIDLWQANRSDISDTSLIQNGINLIVPEVELHALPIIETEAKEVAAKLSPERHDEIVKQGEAIMSSLDELVHAPSVGASLREEIESGAMKAASAVNQLRVSEEVPAAVDSVVGVLDAARSAIALTSFSNISEFPQTLAPISTQQIIATSTLVASNQILSQGVGSSITSNGFQALSTEQIQETAINAVQKVAEVISPVLDTSSISVSDVVQQVEDAQDATTRALESGNVAAATSSAAEAVTNAIVAGAALMNDASTESAVSVAVETLSALNTAAASAAPASGTAVKAAVNVPQMNETVLSDPVIEVITRVVTSVMTLVTPGLSLHASNSANATVPDLQNAIWMGVEAALQKLQSENNLPTFTSAVAAPVATAASAVEAAPVVAEGAASASENAAIAVESAVSVGSTVQDTASNVAEKIDLSAWAKSIGVSNLWNRYVQSGTAASGKESFEGFVSYLKGEGYKAMADMVTARAPGTAGITAPALKTAPATSVSSAAEAVNVSSKAAQAAPLQVISQAERENLKQWANSIGVSNLWSRYTRSGVVAEGQESFEGFVSYLRGEGYKAMADMVTARAPGKSIPVEASAAPIIMTAASSASQAQKTAASAAPVSSIPQTSPEERGKLKSWAKNLGVTNLWNRYSETGTALGNESFEGFVSYLRGEGYKAMADMVTARAPGTEKKEATSAAPEKKAAEVVEVASAPAAAVPIETAAPVASATSTAAIAEAKEAINTLVSEVNAQTLEVQSQAFSEQNIEKAIENIPSLLQGAAAAVQTAETVLASAPASGEAETLVSEAKGNLDIAKGLIEEAKEASATGDAASAAVKISQTIETVNEAIGKAGEVVEAAASADAGTPTTEAGGETVQAKLSDATPAAPAVEEPGAEVELSPTAKAIADKLSIADSSDFRIYDQVKEIISLLSGDEVASDKIDSLTARTAEVQQSIAEDASSGKISFEEANRLQDVMDQNLIVAQNAISNNQKKEAVEAFTHELKAMQPARAASEVIQDAGSNAVIGGEETAPIGPRTTSAGPVAIDVGLAGDTGGAMEAVSGETVASETTASDGKTEKVPVIKIERFDAGLRDRLSSALSKAVIKTTVTEKANAPVKLISGGEDVIKSLGSVAGSAYEARIADQVNEIISLLSKSRVTAKEIDSLTARTAEVQQSIAEDASSGKISFEEANRLQDVMDKNLVVLENAVAKSKKKEAVTTLSLGVLGMAQKSQDPGVSAVLDSSPVQAAFEAIQLETTRGESQQVSAVTSNANVATIAGKSGLEIKTAEGAAPEVRVENLLDDPKIKAELTNGATTPAGMAEQTFRNVLAVVSNEAVSERLVSEGKLSEADLNTVKSIASELSGIVQGGAVSGGTVSNAADSGEGSGGVPYVSDQSFSRNNPEAAAKFLNFLQHPIVVAVSSFIPGAAAARFAAATAIATDLADQAAEGKIIAEGAALMDTGEQGFTEANPFSNVASGSVQQGAGRIESVISSSLGSLEDAFTQDGPTKEGNVGTGGRLGPNLATDAPTGTGLGGQATSLSSERSVVDYDLTIVSDTARSITNVVAVLGADLAGIKSEQGLPASGPLGTGYATLKSADAARDDGNIIQSIKLTQDALSHLALAVPQLAESITAVQGVLENAINNPTHIDAANRGGLLSLEVGLLVGMRDMVQNPENVQEIAVRTNNIVRGVANEVNTALISGVPLRIGISEGKVVSEPFSEKTGVKSSAEALGKNESNQEILNELESELRVLEEAVGMPHSTERATMMVDEDGTIHVTNIPSTKINTGDMTISTEGDTTTITNELQSSGQGNRLDSLEDAFRPDTAPKSGKVGQGGQIDGYATDAAGTQSEGVTAQLKLPSEKDLQKIHQLVTRGDSLQVNTIAAGIAEDSSAMRLQQSIVLNAANKETTSKADAESAVGAARAAVTIAQRALDEATVAAKLSGSQSAHDDLHDLDTRVAVAEMRANNAENLLNKGQYLGSIASSKSAVENAETVVRAAQIAVTTSQNALQGNENAIIDTSGKDTLTRSMAGIGVPSESQIASSISAKSAVAVLEANSLVSDIKQNAESLNSEIHTSLTERTDSSLADAISRAAALVELSAQASEAVRTASLNSESNDAANSAGRSRQLYESALNSLTEARANILDNNPTVAATNITLAVSKANDAIESAQVGAKAAEAKIDNSFQSLTDMASRVGTFEQSAGDSASKVTEAFISKNATEAVHSALEGAKDALSAADTALKLATLSGSEAGIEQARSARTAALIAKEFAEGAQSFLAGGDEKAALTRAYEAGEKVAESAALSRVSAADSTPRGMNSVGGAVPRGGLPGSPATLESGAVLSLEDAVHNLEVAEVNGLSGDELAPFYEAIAKSAAAQRIDGTGGDVSDNPAASIQEININAAAAAVEQAETAMRNAIHDGNLQAAVAAAMQAARASRLLKNAAADAGGDDVPAFAAAATGGESEEAPDSKSETKLPTETAPEQSEDTTLPSEAGWAGSVQSDSDATGSGNAVSADTSAADFTNSDIEGSAGWGASGGGSDTTGSGNAVSDTNTSAGGYDPGGSYPSDPGGLDAFGGWSSLGGGSDSTGSGNVVAGDSPSISSSPSSPSFSGGGGGGGFSGGGGSVICTVLYRHEWLDDATWQADEMFGKVIQPEILAGYHLWAKLVARLMEKSALIRGGVALCALPWAREMAYQMGVFESGSLFGRFLMKVGIPICYYLGVLVKQAENPVIEV